MSCKIGKKLEWRDIKIGQAFYYTGCKGFGVKVGEGDFIKLDCDVLDFQVVGNCLPGELTDSAKSYRKFYDIPKELKECLEEV